MLAETSERLKFLIAFRPGMVSPTLAAQMAATFQWHSGGRLLLNVVTGGDARRTARLRRLPRQGGALRPHRRVPRDRPPPLGRRDGRLRGRAPAGRGGDDPPPAGAGAADLLRRLLAGRARGRGAARRRLPDLGRAARRGRREDRARCGRCRRRARPRAALRHPPPHDQPRHRRRRLGARPRRLLDAVPAETIAQVQAKLRQSESEGQRRMLELHGGSRSDLEVSPNLWAGVGLGRGGAGTALVGSHARGRRADRGVRRGRDRRVRPLRLPAPGGALLVRRGRPAAARAARPLAPADPAERRLGAQTPRPAARARRRPHFAVGSCSGSEAPDDAPTSGSRSSAAAPPGPSPPSTCCASRARTAPLEIELIDRDRAASAPASPTAPTTRCTC